MRVKRVILCIDPDDTFLSVLKILLTTWGYRVAATASHRACPRTGLDLVIVREPDESKHIVPINYSIFTCQILELPELYEPARLREQLRILVRRKRGPKPKAPQSVAASAERKAEV